MHALSDGTEILVGFFMFRFYLCDVGLVTITIGLFGVAFF